MPLIVWAYLGFAGGLLVGFSGSWLLIVGGMGGVTCVMVCLRSGGVWGTGMLFVAGVLLAVSVPRERAPYPRQPPSAADATTFLGRQRMRAERAIDTVFHGDAPLAKALLVADKSELPPALKQRYVAAGIAHRLSISGLHVAIIAAAVEWLLRFLRWPRWGTAAASVMVMGGYVALIGFPLPAVRAGMMFAISALSRAVQRPTSRWAILAGCAFIPLVDPQTVLAVGYQLNIVGVAGVIAGSTVARRVVRPRFRGWRRTVARSLVVSSVATAVTVPLVAWSFGQISLIAPVTNLLVEPVLGMVQPLLFLGLLLAPWRCASTFLADAVHPLLMAVDAIASLMAGIPCASLHVKPALVGAVLAGVASAATIVACVSRFPGRAALIACGAVCAVVWIG